MSTGTFIASFDIEDWFHSHNVGPYVGGDWDTLEGRVERNTHELLDVLGELDRSSTFFVLGWVARRYPALVRRMADEGHEVASHTDRHELLSRMPREGLTRDLARARATLEDLTGSRVLGIRAPSFSISDPVLDCLAEAGYWYDSSYFALRGHGRYGRLASTIDPDLPVVEVRPGFLELPMSRVRLGPAAVPWAGGAYFRLVPYRLFRLGVSRRLRAQSWFMFYLHPWELDAGEIPPAGLPLPARVRTYAGRGRMGADLRRLLAEFGTRRIDDALHSLGFSPPAA